MKLDFGKYTNCTKMAKEIDADFYGQYEHVLVCADTNKMWVAKILVGYDEEYNRDSSKVLIERNNIDSLDASYLKMVDHVDLAITTLQADIDDGCNWDVLECDSVEDALDNLADVFGINEEDCDEN